MPTIERSMQAIGRRLPGLVLGLGLSAMGCAGAGNGSDGARIGEAPGDELPPEGPAPDMPLESRPGPPAGPAPAPAPPTDDPYACTGQGQCVLSCPVARGCCSSSCGCSHAIHQDHVQAYEASYAERCDKTEDCPAMACAYEHYSAVCRDGRCAAQEGMLGY